MKKLSQKVQSVAIIGAGASGLTAAKYLVAERCFQKIDILEQRDRVGGIWNYSFATEKDQLPSRIPQEDPNLPLEQPTWRAAKKYGTNGQVEREATFVSPLYDGLETNIPRTLMNYSDFPFPKETQLFPRFETVLEYLKGYGEDVKHLIQFHVQVVDVRLHDESAGTWAVTRKDLSTGRVRTDVYDALVVANGHYNVPNLPSINGISAWNDAYPNIIRHSKFYTCPETFRDKKVIVVGNSASGIDIASQISKVCQAPLLMSSRSESYFSTAGATNYRAYPPIVEFLSPKDHNRAVRFENGEIEGDIDEIIFCTGYLYSFPFLSSLRPPVIKDGSRTLHVYQQLFYIEHPTLVFPALTQKVIPFPTAEAQSAIFARVWSGRLGLPSKQDMYQWEETAVTSRGNGKSFHVMAFPADADYINYLYEWAANAEKRPGLENGGQGKKGPRWGEKERWTRERFTQIKQAFATKGDARHHCRLPEDLGFDFDAWTRDHSTT